MKSESPPRESFEVIVVGGGPAGSVAAMSLARGGRSVLLIDRTSTQKRKVGESLPSAARPILKYLNLLSLVEEGDHLPSYGTQSSWGSSSIEHNDFIQDPNGLGWHLNRTQFDEDLRQQAITEGVAFLSGRAQVERVGDVWFVTVDGYTVSTSWLIDATGRSASVVKNQGVKRHRDDDLVALYTWVQSGSADGDTKTLIESRPNGWWYTAKLPDGSRVVSFQTDMVDSSKLVQDQELWNKYLSETVHIQKYLVNTIQLSELQRHEAGGSYLEQFFGEGWLAVGDTALSFDPLSSQGLFNALYTGMKAGEALTKALNGDAEELQVYSDRLKTIRSAYEEKRYHYYSQEQRWLAEKFWKKRIIS